MRLTHFFESTLRKEQITSAFLAMALEDDPRFRRHFLSLVAPANVAPANWLLCLKEQNWRLAVENDGVDVRMETDIFVVLIENKVSSAAKQKGQLLRYYVQECKQRRDRSILSVYLAPKGVGQDEVRAVKDSPQFKERGGDHAQHLSWERLLSYKADATDAEDRFVESGLADVRWVIERARQEKYAREGEREAIRDVVDQAIVLLEPCTAVRLRRWSGRDFEEILTVGTNVTMWLDATFEVTEEAPFAPIRTRAEDGHLQLAIRSQFKLAGGIKAGSALAKWWRVQLARKKIDIPGVGSYLLQEDGWFLHHKATSGTQESLARAIAMVGEAVLKTLSYALVSEGMQLAKD